MTNKVELFLDSGAFSAFTKEVEIDIQDYIQFIKDNEEYIDLYANLDVIGDAEATLRNQKIMEEAGLSPIPCFHQGEDYNYLKYYVRNYDYIALGGLAGGRYSKWEVAEHLRRCFEEYVCDKNGIPQVKVHGFGMTSFRFMRQYPWYSVDSTSWILTGRMGSILIPPKRGGKYVYNEDPHKIDVSLKSPKTKDYTSRLYTLHDIVSDRQERQIIMQYLDHKGYTVGESELRKVDKDYELQEGERWFGKEEADSQRVLVETSGKYVPIGGWGEDKIVEIVKEEGICNCYWLRDQLNIIYFLDFARSLPEWPWPFKTPSKTLGVAY